MKNRMSLNLFLLLACIPCCFAQTEPEYKLKKDVVDYYWEMASADGDLISYPLELKDNKWMTVSVADYELEADVDYRKGYIFITDPAKDSLDKAATFQFVIYPRKKDNPLVAISKKKYQNDRWITEVGFWEKRGGKWFNIARKVAPELSYLDYLDGGREVHKLNVDLVEQLPVHFELPKKGTTIKAYLLSEQLTFYCMQIKPDDENCSIRSSIKYNTVELRWNKAKSTFVLAAFKKS